MSLAVTKGLLSSLETCCKFRVRVTRVGLALPAVHRPPIGCHLLRPATPCLPDSRPPFIHMQAPGQSADALGPKPTTD